MCLKWDLLIIVYILACGSLGGLLGIKTYQSMSWHPLLFLLSLGVGGAIGLTLGMFSAFLAEDAIDLHSERRLNLRELKERFMARFESKDR